MTPPRAAAVATARQDDFARLMLDPAAFYPTPKAIVVDGRLSRRQRLLLLEEWAQGIVDRDIAVAAPDSDGGAANIDGGDPPDPRVLAEVTASIDAVEASMAPPSGLLERFWRRMTQE